MPVPASELPILDALSLLRARLQALKRNTDEFVKAQDVLQLYKETLQQVTRLTEVREANERSRYEETQLAQHTSAAMARLRERAGTPSTSSNDGSGVSSSTPTGGTPGPAGPIDKEHQTQEQEMNRVDTTLADVFHLLSLFFLTIGKSRSAPATYCQISIMMKLLDHMKESGVYTQTDLNPFKKRLTELRGMITAEVDLVGIDDEESQTRFPPQEKPLDVSSIEEDAVSHSAMTKLLLRKHDKCRQRLEEMTNSLSVISVDLVPLHQKIIYLRRHLAALAAKGLKVNKPELDQIAEELRKIESSRTTDGKFVILQKGADGAEERLVPTQGQQILSGILEETFEILQEIHSRDEEVDPQLKPIYDRLVEMRTALQNLILTHRWTLKETDLYNFQVSLQEIDRMRVNGKFVDAEGNKPHGQRVLLFNLRRCYGLIYRLMSSSEPISEELMPVANKLATIRRCLNEVLKFGGPFSARDLYPYQLALAQIESIRVDGKFPGRDGSLPEGQAILNAHLSESYEMIEMLKEEMDQDA